MSTQLFAQEIDSITEFSNHFDVYPLNINSSCNEMSPFVCGSKLYFGANRKIKSGIKYSQADGSGELYDIYRCDRIDSIHFSQPQYAAKFSSTFNDGPIAFNDNESEALITANQKDFRYLLKDQKQQEHLKIYASVKNNNGWSAPKMLPLCEGAYTYCHGAFCNNSQKIIFSSDIPGGFGGMDLYSSELIDNKWTAPHNLGKSVNSAANEIFPFINKNGSLYFSSDRKGGPGGLDIYTVFLKDTLRSAAILMEQPVNSVKDDFGVWTNNDGSNGYLTSDRKESEGDNIYYFYTIVPRFEKEIVPKNKFCYAFFEENSAGSAAGPGLEYEWDFGKGQKAKGLEVKHCFDKPGTYPVRLNIVDRTSGDLFYNDVSYDFVVEEPKQLNILCVDTIPAGESFFIDASTSKIEGYTIKKYYWTFDDGLFSIGSKARHKFLKTGIHAVELGVTAEDDRTCKESTFFTVKEIFTYDKSKIAVSDKDKKSSGSEKKKMKVGKKA